MKKLFSAVVGAVFFSVQAFSQNVGIGTDNPLTKLQVAGAISSTPASGTPSSGSIAIPANVSIFRILDDAANTAITVSATSPQPGQYLTIYNTDATNDATFEGQNIAAGGVASFSYINTGWRAVSNTKAGGDLSGTYPNPLVVQIQGRAVAATAPANGEVLKYNTATSQYEPSVGGTVTGVTASNGLTAAPSGTTVDVKLGGTLSGATTITESAAGQNVTINNTDATNADNTGDLVINRAKPGGLGGTLTLRNTGGAATVGSSAALAFELDGTTAFDNAGVVQSNAEIRGQITGGTNASSLIFTNWNGTVQQERMRIYHDGNIGIGTNAPNNKLDVAGQIGVGARTPIGTTTVTPNWGNALIFSGGTGMNASYDSDNSDPLWMARYNAADNGSELRVVIGDDPGNAADRFVIGAMAGFPNYSNAGTYTPYYTFGADGNMGVGVTAPSYKVDVAGDINSSTGYRIAGGATSGNYLRGNGTQFVSSAIQAGDIPSLAGSYVQNQFSAAQTGEFYLSGRGRIEQSLYVSMNNANGGGIVLSDDGDIVDLNDSYGTMRFSYGLRIGNNNGASSTGTAVQLSSGAAGSGGISYITGSNFGVGINAPVSRLHVSNGTPTGTLGTLPANTVLTIDNANASNYITFRNSPDNGTYAGLQFLDNNAGGYIAFRNYSTTGNSDAMIYGAYQDHIFQNGTAGTVDGNTETMRIKQSGNVGIGVSAPATKLDVNGAIWANQGTDDWGFKNGPVLGRYSDVGAGVGGAFPLYMPETAQGLTVTNTSDAAFFGLVSRGANFNDYNAVIAWGDDVGDNLEFKFNNVNKLVIGSDGSVTAGGDTRFGCRANFWALSDGRICMESTLRGPSNHWIAIATCKTVGPGSRVCTHTDFQQACGAGFAPYGVSSGWYGDHGVAPGGNWDDEFGIWNSASCADNNDGPAIDAGSADLYYRCCY